MNQWAAREARRLVTAYHRHGMLTDPERAVLDDMIDDGQDQLAVDILLAEVAVGEEARQLPPHSPVPGQD